VSNFYITKDREPIPGELLCYTETTVRLPVACRRCERPIELGLPAYTIIGAWRPGLKEPEWFNGGVICGPCRGELARPPGTCPHCHQPLPSPG
jgi:hypothetical protein